MSAWLTEQNGKIIVRWKFNGKYGQRKAPDKRTAKRLIKEIETCHALGYHWRPDASHCEKLPTLGEVIEAFLVSLARTKAEKTVRNRKTALISFIQFLRASKSRGKLTPDMVDEIAIERFHDVLIDENLSATTARQYATSVSLFWEWAERSREYGDLFERYRKPELPHSPPPRLARAPTWAEIDDVITTQRDSEPRRLMVVLRYTGLRVKQAGRLTWDDFDLDGARMRIRPKLGKSALEKRGRIIPITPHLVAELAGWGRRAGDLFPRGNRDESLHLESLRRKAARAWKRSEADPALYEGQTSHLYRKAFTSELIRRGADRWAVELLLGRTTGLGGDIYTDPAFVFDRMVQACALISKVGDDVSTHIHQALRW